MLRKILGLGFAALTAFLVMGAPPSHAVAVINETTYDFTGTCRDCAGTGTGVLELNNYTLGTSATSSNFISFSYTSNLLTYSVTAGDLNSFNATFTALPGTAAVTLFANGFATQFISRTNGTWCTGPNCADDDGPSSSWSVAGAAPVPEPASIGLAIVGIAGLAASRRRRA